MLRLGLSIWARVKAGGIAAGGYILNRASENIADRSGNKMQWRG